MCYMLPTFRAYASLNDQARKDAVNQSIAASRCHIACLQEAKIENIDPRDAAYIGAHRLCSHALRPAVETRGGILMLWDDSHVDATDIHLGTFSISAMITIKECGTIFRLTSVYGPSIDPDKPSFLAELVALMPTDGQKWLVLGDFNLIYRASDKNNRNLNLRLMGLFKNALDSCQLSEIELQNRRFTWSNERDNPTLIKLDRAFSNAAWDLSFDNHVLHALSSSLSDHCLTMPCSRGIPTEEEVGPVGTGWPRPTTLSPTGIRGCLIKLVPQDMYISIFGRPSLY